MSQVTDIETGVLERIDEGNPPVFWDLTNELRMLVIEGMCEATLLTGFPQVKQSTTPVSLAAFTSFFPNPANAFAILRMEVNGLPVRKCSLWDMDLDHMNWQQDAPGTVPTEWMPIGLSGFAIHPQMLAPVNAIFTVVQNPVTTAPPYDGTQILPFQSEFNMGFEMYAAHAAKLKEGNGEFDAGMGLLEGYLSVMAELSIFGLRADSLRFSRSLGTAAELNPVEKK